MCVKSSPLYNFCYQSVCQIRVGVDWLLLLFFKITSKAVYIKCLPLHINTEIFGGCCRRLRRHRRLLSHTISPNHPKTPRFNLCFFLPLPLKCTIFFFTVGRVYKSVFYVLNFVVDFFFYIYFFFFFVVGASHFYCTP